VRGLKQGRTEAPEGERVRPVPEDQIEAVLPFVSAAVRAMIELQRLSGMRPGEVVLMRTCDIERKRKVWLYRPGRHKSEHHGHERMVPLGPRAQSVLEPFLDRDAEAHLFSPREAEEARNGRRSLTAKGRRTRRRQTAKRKRPWRDHFDVATYRRAIQRACERADSPRWHPHQLRHNAATALREQFGIEVARVVLGHRSAAVTEIYAEIDRERAIEAMAEVG